MSTLPRPLKCPPIFPLEKGLVAWYPFDDRSGAVLRDRSGKKNHGTLVGPTWGAGHRGSALIFNGSTQYVNVPDASSLKTFTQLTLIACFKGSALVATGDAHTLCSKLQWQNYLLFIDDGQRLKATITADAQVDCGGTSVHAVGKEYVDGLTYDGANMKVYVNGSLEKTQAQTGAIATSTSPLQIGRIGDIWNTWYYQGVIRTVYMLNRALTAAEMKRYAESELMLARH